jgi:hypothetical protein
MKNKISIITLFIAAFLNNGYACSSCSKAEESTVTGRSDPKEGTCGQVTVKRCMNAYNDTRCYKADGQTVFRITDIYSDKQCVAGGKDDKCKDLGEKNYGYELSEFECKTASGNKCAVEMEGTVEVKIVSVGAKGSTEWQLRDCEESQINTPVKKGKHKDAGSC